MKPATSPPPPLALSHPHTVKVFCLLAFSLFIHSRQNGYLPSLFKHHSLAHYGTPFLFLHQNSRSQLGKYLRKYGECAL